MDPCPWAHYPALHRVTVHLPQAFVFPGPGRGPMDPAYFGKLVEALQLSATRERLEYRGNADMMSLQDIQAIFSHVQSRVFSTFSTRNIAP